MALIPLNTPPSTEPWEPPSARVQVEEKTHTAGRKHPLPMAPRWECIGEETGGESRTIRPLTEVIGKIAFGEEPPLEAISQGAPTAPLPAPEGAPVETPSTSKEQEVSNLKAMFSMLDLPEELLKESPPPPVTSPESSSETIPPTDEELQVTPDPQALEEAFQQARERGEEEGRAQAQKQLEPIQKRYCDTIQELGTLMEEIRKEQEGALVELTMALLSRIVRQELALNKGHIIAYIKEVLQLVREGDRVTIQVSSEDYAVLMAHPDHFWEEREGEVRLEPSEEIQRGGCTAQCSSGCVDGTIEAQLEALSQGLTTPLKAVDQEVRHA